jgi:hypothetical protein
MAHGPCVARMVFELGEWFWQLQKIILMLKAISAEESALLILFLTKWW